MLEMDSDIKSSPGKIREQKREIKITRLSKQDSVVMIIRLIMSFVLQLRNTIFSSNIRAS